APFLESGGCGAHGHVLLRGDAGGGVSRWGGHLAGNSSVGDSLAQSVIAPRYPVYPRVLADHKVRILLAVSGVEALTKLLLRIRLEGGTRERRHEQQCCGKRPLRDAGGPFHSSPL